MSDNFNIKMQNSANSIPGTVLQIYEGMKNQPGKNPKVRLENNFNNPNYDAKGFYISNGVFENSQHAKVAVKDLRETFNTLGKQREEAIKKSMRASELLLKNNAVPPTNLGDLIFRNVTKLDRSGVSKMLTNYNNHSKAMQYAEPFEFPEIGDDEQNNAKNKEIVSDSQAKQDEIKLQFGGDEDQQQNDHVELDLDGAVSLPIGATLESAVGVNPLLQRYESTDSDDDLYDDDLYDNVKGTDPQVSGQGLTPMGNDITPEGNGSTAGGGDGSAADIELQFGGDEDDLEDPDAEGLYEPGQPEHTPGGPDETPGGPNDTPGGDAPSESDKK